MVDIKVVAVASVPDTRKEEGGGGSSRCRISLGAWTDQLKQLVETNELFCVLKTVWRKLIQ